MTGGDCYGNGCRALLICLLHLGSHWRPQPAPGSLKLEWVTPDWLVRGKSADVRGRVIGREDFVCFFVCLFWTESHHVVCAINSSQHSGG